MAVRQWFLPVPVPVPALLHISDQILSRMRTTASLWGFILLRILSLMCSRAGTVSVGNLWYLEAASPAGFLLKK